MLYSISADPAERGKRERAIGLMDRSDGGALSVQVLQEFYAEATRPSRRDSLPHNIAAALVAAWTRFKVQPTTMAILAGALEIKAAHGLSYWDSAVVAAARALGCTELFSEDLPHGREVDGVRIVDPFR